MNGADDTGRSSLYQPGRALLIAVVIVFSSLSFILGYFVGRNEPRKEAETLSKPQDALPASGSALLPVNTPVGMADPPAGKSLQPVESESAVNRPEVPAPATASPDSSANALKRSHEKQTKTAWTEDVPPSPESGEKAADSEAQKKKVIYCVQMGAMENLAKAEKLRKRYEKKGYKTYLFVTKNKKHGKIYKIRVGEFENRNDAETLSARIKKSEGLNTFVTTKDN